MKKSFLLITITILLFITGSNSAQSIIHPNKVGFGYAYGYSDVNGMNLYGNSFYISSGQLDFVLNFYDLETGNKDIPYTSAVISYTSIKPKRKIYPSFHLGYSGGNYAVLSFGISVAGEIFHDTDFKILPEGGVEFAYAKGSGGNNNETETFNLAGNAAFYADINFAFGGENVPFYITLSPGIEVESKATSYSIAVAASIVP